MQKNKSNIVIYNDGELELKISQKERGQAPFPKLIKRQNLFSILNKIIVD